MSKFKQPKSVIIEELNLENSIKDILKNSEVYFDYYKVDTDLTKIKLDVITINKKTQAKFLLCESVADTNIDNLRYCLKYISDIMTTQNLYCVEWADSDGEVGNSWLYSTDMTSAIEKFKYASNNEILKIEIIKNK